MSKMIIKTEFLSETDILQAIVEAKLKCSL